MTPADFHWGRGTGLSGSDINRGRNNYVILMVNGKAASYYVYHHCTCDHKATSMLTSHDNECVRQYIGPREVSQRLQWPDSSCTGVVSKVTPLN